MFKYKIAIFLFLAFFIIGCVSSRFTAVKRSIYSDFSSNKYKKQHTGFLVVDLATKDTLVHTNDSKYFIPASTTKWFTFYSCLKMLGHQIPALKYQENGNQISILGTGDPTWLHPHFRDTTALQLLKKYDTIFLNLDNYTGGTFGPGWAWEDYPYSFSPEISAVPLFGNVITAYPVDTLNIWPPYFNSNVHVKNDKPLRALKENRFHVPQQRSDTLQIPYITSKNLTSEFLSQETGKVVVVLDSLPNTKWKVLPGFSRDTLLKRMLWKSDNFLAEQLMLTCSSTLSDTLDFEKARDFMLSNHLKDGKDEPRWVDGSGLSRYNLFTPESMVSILDKLYTETDSLQLFSLVPQWNINGTMNEKETKQTPSFIFAKSGSMGNVYNLCGYLKTQSGKLLAFSFMNNHFRRPSREVRKDIFHLLNSIHLSY